MLNKNTFVFATVTSHSAEKQHVNVSSVFIIPVWNLQTNCYFAWQISIAVFFFIIDITSNS